MQTPEDAHPPNEVPEDMVAPENNNGSIKRLRRLAEMLDFNGAARKRHADALARASRPLDRPWVRSFMLSGGAASGDVAGELSALTSPAVTANAMVLNAALRFEGLFPDGAYDLHDNASVYLVPCITIGGETVGIAVEQTAAVNDTGLHMALQNICGNIPGAYNDKERALGKFFFSAATGELLLLTRKMLLEPLDIFVHAASLFAGLCFNVPLCKDSALVTRPKMRLMWWSGVDHRFGECRSLGGELSLGISSRTLTAVVDAEHFVRGRYSGSLLFSKFGAPKTDFCDARPGRKATSDSRGRPCASDDDGGAAITSCEAVDRPCENEKFFAESSRLVRWGGQGEVLGCIPGLSHAVHVRKRFMATAAFEFSSQGPKAVELQQLGISRSSLAIKVRKMMVGRPSVATSAPIGCGSGEGSPLTGETANNVSVRWATRASGNELNVSNGEADSACRDVVKMTSMGETRGDVGGVNGVLDGGGFDDDTGTNGRSGESYGDFQAVQRERILAARSLRNRMSAARSNEARRQRNLKLREELEAGKALARGLERRRSTLLEENQKLRAALGIHGLEPAAASQHSCPD